MQPNHNHLPYEYIEPLVIRKPKLAPNNSHSPFLPISDFLKQKKENMIFPLSN